MAKPTQKSKPNTTNTSSGKNAMGKLLQKIFSKDSKKTSPKSVPLSAKKGVKKIVTKKVKQEKVKKVSVKKGIKKTVKKTKPRFQKKIEKKETKKIVKKINKKITPSKKKARPISKKNKKVSKTPRKPKKIIPVQPPKKNAFLEKVKNNFQVPEFQKQKPSLRKTFSLSADHLSFKNLGFLEPLNSEKLCSDFRARINGAEDLVEFPVSEDTKEISSKKQTVIAISVGGSNIKRGLGVISPEKKELTLSQFSHEKYETEIVYTNPEKFWEKVFGIDALKWIKKEGENVHVALTLGCPIRKEGDDFFMVHGACKYNVPDAGPFGPGEKAKKNPLSLRTSLLEFLQKKTKIKNIQLNISLNDVFSAHTAFSHHNKGKINGVLILGSGFNIGADNVNFEVGHYTDVPFSVVELEVFKKLKLRGDLECVVSGKILKEVFAGTLERILGKNHIAVRKILNMKKCEAVIFVFDLAYNPKVKLPTGFAEKLKPTLIFVAKKIVSRMTRFTAAALLSAQKYVRKQVIFFAEGSLLTKCPAHIEAINHAVRQMTQNANRTDILIQEDLPVKNKSTAKPYNIDASFVGTFFIGLV